LNVIIEVCKLRDRRSLNRNMRMFREDMTPPLIVMLLIWAVVNLDYM